MKKAISFLLLLMIFCASLCSCSNAASSGSNTTVIKNSRGEYYLGASNIVRLDNNSVTAVTGITDDDKFLSLISNKYVVDNGEIYAQLDDNKLVKYTFKDSNTLESEEWVNEDTLNKSPVVSEKTSGLPYTGGMTNWSLNGDYIYFIYDPRKEYFMTEGNIAFKLGRMSKDGSEINFIDGITANSFVVNDDWIYYFDNGFIYDESNESNYRIDESRIGLYRIKTEGGSRELLKGGFGSIDFRIGCYDDMVIYGEYIYFIDNSDQGNSRICKIKTDGADFQYLTPDGAYCYTIDEERDCIYYRTGERMIDSMSDEDFCRLDLKTGNCEKLFMYNRFGYSGFCVYKNYLYFKNNGNFNLGQDKDSVCGIRYNIDTKIMEYLYGKYEIEFTSNDDDFFKTRTESEPEYHWEQYEY